MGIEAITTNVIVGLALGNLLVDKGWPAAVAFIASVILKGFAIHELKAKPDKKDEVTQLQLEVAKLKEQMTGFNLKIFGRAGKV